MRKNNSIKKLFTSLLLSSLLPAVPSWGAEQDFENYWTSEAVFSQGIDQDKLLLGYNENGSEVGSTSYIYAIDPKSNLQKSLCKKIGEAPCDTKSILNNQVNVYTQLVMPKCETKSSADCVASLELITSSGERVIGEFIRQVSSVVYENVADYEFPRTGTQLLYRVPGVLHAGGTDTYAVEYTQYLQWLGSKIPHYLDLKVAVVPYVETEFAMGRTQVLKAGNMPMGPGDYTIEPWNYPGGSIWMEEGVVGKIANFAKGVGASVTIRANKQFGGWLRGRLSGAEFETSQISSTQQSIAISGKSVEVPRIYGIVNEQEYKQYTTQPIFFYEKHRGGGIGGDVSDPEGIFVWLNAIKKVSNDTARGVHRSWMFATVPIWKKAGCYKTSGVQGLVATNAAVYAGGAPNYEGGFLNYNIGGLHFLPDGSEAIGTYDLVMRSDIARCLYGFSKAPVSGTVTVSGEGDQKIATTTLAEKNGWLRLSANGFTFSTKTIKVKLSQKKITITCVSKSLPTKSKKVTDYSPKCPSGYVKK